LVKEVFVTRKRQRPSRRKASKVSLWRRTVRLGKAFTGIVGFVKALMYLWNAVTGDGSWPFSRDRLPA